MTLFTYFVWPGYCQFCKFVSQNLCIVWSYFTYSQTPLQFWLHIWPPFLLKPALWGCLLGSLPGKKVGAAGFAGSWRSFSISPFLACFFSKSVAWWDICSNDLTELNTLQPCILFLVGKKLIKPGAQYKNTIPAILSGRSSHV